MKVVLINGSPKPKESGSAVLLKALQKRLDNKAECSRCTIVSDEPARVLDTIKGCDAVVFAFPLYIDGIPSHLLHFLDEVKADIGSHAPGATVWAVANNGFYEAEQNTLALSMMQQFCTSAGLTWGQGLGVGAGEMIAFAPIGYGPLRSIGRALDTLASNILASRSSETQFAEPDFPRFLYKASAHHHWESLAKQHGLKKADLRTRISQTLFA